MSWPKFLVEELAERRCVIVAGAGVSCSCQSDDGIRPPTWKELLSELETLISDGAARREVQQFIDAERFLQAAQIISGETVREDRERVIKGAIEKSYKPSDWINIIRDLDQNIIVTTNYDCILEDACPRQGFRTHIHKDKEAAKVLRAPESLILKVHGCIRRDSGSLILAMSDYHAMRADHPHCFQLLEAIFTTHTALFIGYSMNDPDLQLVMQNIKIAFPYAPPHILFTSESMHSAVRSAMEKSLNLKFVTYPTGDHAKGLEMLKTLYEDVQSMRASRTASI